MRQTMIGVSLILSGCGCAIYNPKDALGILLILIGTCTLVVRNRE